MRMFPESQMMIMFVYVLAIGLSGLSMTQGATNCPDKYDADVLILGAGMTGLSAAKTLSDNGTTNFLIFEGEDHIGGRVRSLLLEKSGARVELGANWIEQIDKQQPNKHPLWNIVQKCGGVEGFWQKDPSQNASIHVYDYNGMNITNNPEFRSRLIEWQQIFKELIALAEYRDDQDLPDISVRQALEMKGWTPKTAMDNLIEWIGFDWEYAGSPDNASLQNNLPETFFGNSNGSQWEYFITDQKFGYKKILDCLVQDVLSANDKRIHFNSVVRSVNWSDDCVCVTTDENNTAMQQYCAPYAIITFSVGVLKSNSVHFDPPLPQSKIDAMKNLSDAFYLKIFLEFETIFWDTGIDYILHVDPVRGNYIHFQSLARYPATWPSVLIATVIGKNAEAVYVQSKEKTTADIMLILRKIYGQKLADPVNVVIPDWGINPYYKGMYSLVRVGYSEHDKKQLAAPLGRLYFGGEATSGCCSAYVHGAYLSGIDVANAILTNNRSIHGH